MEILCGLNTLMNTVNSQKFRLFGNPESFKTKFAPAKNDYHLISKSNVQKTHFAFSFCMDLFIQFFKRNQLHSFILLRVESAPRNKRISIAVHPRPPDLLDFLLNHALCERFAAEFRLIKDVAIRVFGYNIELAVRPRLRIIVIILSDSIKRNRELSRTILTNQILPANLLELARYILLFKIIPDIPVIKHVGIHHIHLRGISKHIPLVKQRKIIRNGIPCFALVVHIVNRCFLLDNLHANELFQHIRQRRTTGNMGLRE